MNIHASPAPDIDAILSAARRLEGLAVRTPLLESPVLSERLGGRVLFKPETLQRTGSFKFRGAYNKLASLPEVERARGVVAFSSGNHAQGVAAAAAMFGVRAVIAMPGDAPRIKIDNVRRMGAEIVPYDRLRDDRAAVVRPWIEEGLALVPPFDDPFVIAGQGTIGLELAEQAKEIGVALDAVAVPCGGGGLSSGISLAVKDASPATEIWAVEPEGFDDTRRSLEGGERVANAPGPVSICDALMSAMPGELTFSINRTTLAGVVGVSDDAVRDAMREAMAHLKLVVEPGGAAAMAAVLSGAVDVRGRCVAVVLSGGNVDGDAYARILGA